MKLEYPAIFTPFGGNAIPSASPSDGIIIEKNAFVKLIVLDMDSYAQKYGNGLAKMLD